MSSGSLHDPLSDPPEDTEMELGDHLVELGERMRNIVKVLIISTAIFGFLPEPWIHGDFTKYSPPLVIEVTKWLIDFQFQRIGSGIQIYATGPTQALSAYILVAMAMGLLVSWPVIIREIYRYIKPAMYPHEKAAIKTYVILFLILFWGGCALSFYFIMPLTYQILMKIVLAGDIVPIFTIESFIGFLFFGVIGIGLAFTFPIFSTMLVITGLYDAKDLRARWREAITGLFILTAFLTPDPTPVTTVILFTPMAMLYYLAILLAERVEGGADVIDSKDSLLKAALIVSADLTEQTEE